MKSFSFILALAALAITASAAPTSQPDAIPDRYIVMLKPEADHSTLSRALKAEIARENSREDASGITNALDREFKHTIKGFAGTFSTDLVSKLKNNPNVAAVVPDRIMRVLTSNPRPTWGMRRISQRQREPGAPFIYPDTAGNGVTVYVIDTGIHIGHSNFDGRARWGFSSDSSWPRKDDNGHGTHVAGTVASRAFGVADQAKVVAVKVMDGNGRGPTSGIIAGIEYVVSEARKAGKTVVANLSLGGEADEALDAAVKAAVDAGVVMVLAAGNESQDACNVSPAREPSGITVAAIDQNDRLASFSNWGKCVDIAAPGVKIESTWNNGRIETIDGTSMAAPHVAGAAALLLGTNPNLTPAEVSAALIKSATPNVITGLRSTPNRLLYVEP
ncbi:putative serine proteinase, precursor [Catenaria anguillulae PL171]|uniref:Putative serine proteinase n=1 Tax=Catenaria anguillulae PL171 TaxID=765915 RepID=A0A1Y2HD83_9FUNG|nr:putative serine proteinase, precursor [Catenaria anguillulae PL171]